MPDAAIVYLNGRFLPRDEACVPVMDRGFLLGDGVYEVIPAFGGRPFRLDEHLQRLDNSLAAVRIRNPFNRQTWTELIDGVIERNGGGDLSIYLQVTRGVTDKRDHAFGDNIEPTVLIMATPMAGADADELRRGHRAITVEDIRWQRCDIKAITLLANLLLRQQAVDQGAAEAILVRDGKALEGAASNLFIVEDGVIVTPPKDNHVLPGITRDLILEIAAANGMPWREDAIPVERLRNADEVWVTSSTREILPITELDGQRVGDGRPGPVWERMFALYQNYKRRLSGD